MDIIQRRAIAFAAQYVAMPCGLASKHSGDPDAPYALTEKRLAAIVARSYEAGAKAVLALRHPA